MVMCNVFSTNSILVNTCDNHMTDYTQEIAQKKSTLYGGTKMSSHSMLKIQKITFVAGVFHPRDGCFPHVSKIIFCSLFGLK